jgi:CheY-like chemotaxis protein
MLVAVTANALPPQLDQYLAAGFDRCLAKPVRLAELESVIASWWRRTADGAEWVAAEAKTACAHAHKSGTCCSLKQVTNPARL